MNVSGNPGFEFEITERTADFLHLKFGVCSLVQNETVFSLDVNMTQRALVPTFSNQIFMLLICMPGVEEHLPE